MKLITYAVFLIALRLTAAKQFEECEFAIELYSRHQVPREDIYKHFCIASSLHTSRNQYPYKGIYAIGSQWWCRQDAPGGGCNVTCSDLLDDDIADDVACANLILSQQGVQGWGRSEANCRNQFEQKTDDCLVSIDVLNGLTVNVSEISMMTTTVVPTATVETTIAPITTTEKSIVPTTTEKLITPTTTEKSIVPTTTERLIVSTTSAIETTTTNHNRNSTNGVDEVTDFNSSPQQTLKEPIECSCATQNVLLIIMVVVLLGAVAVVLFKYRNLKRFVHKRSEFGEHLIS